MHKLNIVAYFLICFQAPLLRVFKQWILNFEIANTKKQSVYMKSAAETIVNICEAFREETLHFLQIHRLKLNLCRIASSRQRKELVSTWTQIKQCLCVFIKMVPSPH